MNLIKKSDVKNHLSPRHRTRNHPAAPASQPEAAGFSGEQSGEAQIQMAERWLVNGSRGMALPRRRLVRLKPRPN
jgi:hypothetical protein